jgi:spore germination protein
MRAIRGAAWPYLLLSVALVGALSFGWYQTRLKNQLALAVENRYMSAFHKLKWTSENIEERMAKLMATNDRHLQENLLADLRVFSAQAVEHMSVLPFLTMQTPRIENFLNTLRMRTDELHYELSTGGNLAEAQWAELMELRRQAVFFEAELSEVLGLVGNNAIHWRDTVRATAPTAADTATTPITRSVLHLEQNLQAPPGEENVMQPDKGPMARPKVSPGQMVDPPTAVAAIKRFLTDPLQGEPKHTGTSDPEDKLNEFSLHFFDAQKQNGTPLNFGVSVHGGHVIFMIDGRPVTEKRLTQDHLVPRAQEMLRKWGYANTVFVSAAENDGTMVMDFAPQVGEVAIHTQLLKVMLTMDNGELVGFDAKNYWVNRHERNLPLAKLSADEARQRLAPRLQVEQALKLALVADRRGRERLVWSAAARLDEQRYRIFIDAQTGAEVDLQRVAGDPAPPLQEGQ